MMALSEGPRPAPTTLPEGPYKEALLRAATFRWGIYNFVMRLQNSEVYGQKGSYRKEYQLVKEKYSIGRESITAMGAAVGVAWKAGWQKVSGVVSFNLMNLNGLETEQAKHQYLNQFKQEGIDSNQFHIAIAIGATKENVVRTENVDCLISCPYDQLLGDERPLKMWGDLRRTYGDQSSLADLTVYMCDAIAAFTDIPEGTSDEEKKKLYVLAPYGINQIRHDFLAVCHGAGYMLQGHYFDELVEDIKVIIERNGDKYPKMKAFFVRYPFNNIDEFKASLLKLLSEKLHEVSLKSFDDLDVHGCNIFNGLVLTTEASEQYKAVFEKAIALPVDSSAGTVGEDSEEEIARSAAAAEDDEFEDALFEDALDEEGIKARNGKEDFEEYIKMQQRQRDAEKTKQALKDQRQRSEVTEADKTTQPLNKNPTKSSNNSKVVLSCITIITGLVAYKAIDVHLPKLSFPNKLLGALAVALLMLIVVLSIASCVRQYDGQRNRKVARRGHGALSSASSSSSANGDMAGGPHSGCQLPEKQEALSHLQQQQVYLSSQDSEGEDFPAEFLMKRSNGDSSDPQGSRNMFHIDIDDDQYTSGTGDNTDDREQTLKLQEAFTTGRKVTFASETSRGKSHMA